MLLLGFDVPIQFFDHFLKPINFHFLLRYVGIVPFDWLHIVLEFAQDFRQLSLYLARFHFLVKVKLVLLLLFGQSMFAPFYLHLIDLHLDVGGQILRGPYNLCDFLHVSLKDA